MNIEMNLEVLEETISTNVTDSSKELEMKLENYSGGGSGTNDYEKLRNLPSLDGQRIIGDVKERDPTVPSWAKENSKPVYTAEEVGGIDSKNAVSIEEISSWF